MYLTVNHPSPAPTLVFVNRILLSEVPMSAHASTLALLAPAVILMIPKVPPAIAPAAVNAVASPT